MGVIKVISLFVCLMVVGTSAFSKHIKVTDSDGMPLSKVMVTLEVMYASLPENRLPVTVTRFSDLGGFVSFDSITNQGSASALKQDTKGRYRARSYGYQDAIVNVATITDEIKITMVKELDPLAIAFSKPANSWVEGINFPNDEIKKHFLTQCTYCHQQGSQFTRIHRTEEEWRTVVQRMINYGSHLSSDSQEIIPKVLAQNYKRLNGNPEMVPAVRHWDDYLLNSEVIEWKIGDSQSNMHDLLLSTDGVTYVGDDLNGRLYKLDVKTGHTEVFELPYVKGDEKGGPLGFDIDVFPGQGYVRLHSLAESKVDGHIFTTDPRQNRIHEFNPDTKEFSWHQIPDGFFPHTIRTDSKDRVWFTMAASNHIGMIDRHNSNEIVMYELPSRSFMEWLQIKLLSPVITLAENGFSLSSLPISEDSEGFPFPYGIDISPDGTVWFARLHANDIGSINPDTGEIKLYKTPFTGPRRMRADEDGYIWVTAYADSKIAKFSPSTSEFEIFELPVIPVGSEIPYALNIDHKRHLVWVTGTSSDSLMSMDMITKEWRVYPLPRKGSYTRELEIMNDGSVLTSTSSMPAWHEEGMLPTVIRLKPGS